MKKEQLYKFVPIKEAKDICDEKEYFIRNFEESEFSKMGKDIKRVVSKYPDAFTHILLPFHPSPKEISEEEIEPVIMEAIKLYQRDRSGITGLYPGRYNDFCQYLQIWIKERLSLPSSGSKTEEEKYRISLIDELINMQEHPEDSNKEWKDAIISVAREKGYGNKK